MIDKKGLALFACLICGPFVSVGATVFYRRALQWWYEHEIDMSPDDALQVSWAVLFGISLIMVYAFLCRMIDGRWPWRSK